MTAYRKRLYQLVFCWAALYNLAFGLWTCLSPLSFFKLFDLPPPLYPAIWQCLGMVVGIYGFAYGYAALHIERGRPFIAIGLLGKVVGPIGWISTVTSGEWPMRTFTLILFNDIVWWLPFIIFLFEGTPGDRVRSLAPYACGAINALGGLIMLFVLRPGTEVNPDVAARMAYMAKQAVLWRIGWGVWICAGISLLWFYAWWGARLPTSIWGISACMVAATGVTCDLLAESLYIGWLPDTNNSHLVETIQTAGSLLTGGAANGLYTIAGIILTLGTRSLPSWLKVWTWLIWISGICLTAATLAGNVTGMVIATGATFVLFCPWTAAMGWMLRFCPRS